jgi:hypothetical protein
MQTDPHLPIQTTPHFAEALDQALTEIGGEQLPQPRLL